MDEITESGNSQLRDMNRKFRAESAKYLLAAFGLVAGLAWNEAVKSLIDSIFPIESNSVPAKFIYALVVTIIVVVFTYYLSRLAKKEEN